VIGLIGSSIGVSLGKLAIEGCGGCRSRWKGS
jgi:hypothetical protein